MHPDCVAAYEDASRLLASLGTRSRTCRCRRPGRGARLRDALVRAGHPGPGEPVREDRLLPFTAYMRSVAGTAASDLVFAQAYLRIVVRQALPC